MFDFCPFGYKIGRRALPRFFQLLTFIIIYFILFYLTWTSSGKSVCTTGKGALKLVTLPNLKVTRLKGDVTRNDSQGRFLAQCSQRCNIVAILFRMIATLFQHCNAIWRQKLSLPIVPLQCWNNVAIIRNNIATRLGGGGASLCPHHTRGGEGGTNVSGKQERMS